MRRRRARTLVVGLAVCALIASGGTAAVAGATVRAKASRGCRAASKVPPGEEKVTLTSGGVERWYFRHVPPAHDGKHPVPVVFDLHGYLEGADLHRRMSELGAFGDAHGFATIVPQGQGDVAHWDTGLASPDVRFIGDLLDQVERTLCVDVRRVFVTGLSNGAMMASTLACAYSDRFAAAAPVAGIQAPKGCRQKRAVPFVTFHGTADPYLAFNGGFGPGVASLPVPDGSGRTLGQAGVGTSRPQGPSVPDVVAAVAKRNHCRPKPHEQQIASDVTLLTYQCPARASVDFYRIEGGGHAWPGSQFSKAIAAAVGPTTFSIDADQVMWQFFQRHPLPA